MADRIGCIVKACAITDQIFSGLVKSVYSFRTERDIDCFVRRLTRRFGVRIAFSPIVASGKNAADPHHRPTNALLKGFVVVDFGVKVGGFCSDMARMFYFGVPSKKELGIYCLLLAVQEGAVRCLRSGKRYFDLDRLARKNLGRYRKFFVHSLGHGVGRKVHELPTIASVFRKRKLTAKRLKRIEAIKSAKAKVGDVVTIEPGIYVKKKFGLRVEDTLLVKKDCALSLTKFSKELVVVN